MKKYMFFFSVIMVILQIMTKTVIACYRQGDTETFVYFANQSIMAPENLIEAERIKGIQKFNDFIADTSDLYRVPVAYADFRTLEQLINMTYDGVIPEDIIKQGEKNEYVRIERTRLACIVDCLINIKRAALIVRDVQSDLLSLEDMPVVDLLPSGYCKFEVMLKSSAGKLLPISGPIYDVYIQYKKRTHPSPFKVAYEEANRFLQLTERE